MRHAADSKASAGSQAGTARVEVHEAGTEARHLHEYLRTHIHTCTRDVIRSPNCRHDTTDGPGHV